VAFVQGTAARKAVVAADAEFLLETVMLKDLLHGDRRFDGAEVNESVSVGHMVSSFVVVWICSEGWERTVRSLSYHTARKDQMALLQRL
jgi:hypothetical protein